MATTNQIMKCLSDNYFDLCMHARTHTPIRHVHYMYIAMPTCVYMHMCANMEHAQDLEKQQFNNNNLAQI